MLGGGVEVGLLYCSRKVSSHFGEVGYGDRGGESGGSGQEITSFHLRLLQGGLKPAPDFRGGNIAPSVRRCEELARQAKPTAPPSLQTLGQQRRWGSRFRLPGR